MWYEESDQLVRAPTPSAFDRLVKNLEDNDQVMFQSISLPKSDQAKEAEEEPPNQSDSFGDDFIEIGDDFIESGSGNDEAKAIDDDERVTIQGVEDDPSICERADDMVDVTGVEELKRTLSELMREGESKDRLITVKDAQITLLQRELTDLEMKKVGATGRPVTAGPRESAEYYKSMYEEALTDFEILTNDLRGKGMMRVVSARSARAIKVDL